MKVFITGCAGFIGFHLCKILLKENINVCGIDSLNNYYDPKLKNSRLNLLRKNPNFSFYKIDICNLEKLEDCISKFSPTHIVHLAAQAGVRYSIENPKAYIDSNLLGFFNILDLAKKIRIKHFLYASSSSVYGGNLKIPFSTSDNVDHPISLYAATKKSNELMAHAYSSLYSLPTTGLRFFTVYGPWGRPDMALFKFVSAILNNKTIDIYNHGNHKRDFTYIDDIISCVRLLLEKIPSNNNLSEDNLADQSKSPWKIYNIGNNKPIELMYFIEIIEKKLNKKANINFMDIQPGDVVNTYADIDPLHKDLNFKPITSIEDGVNNFIDWYIEYYK